MPRKSMPSNPGELRQSPAAPAARNPLWAVLVLAVLGAAAVAWLGARDRTTPSPSSAPMRSIQTVAADFVGSASCATCHEQAYAGWTKSQHAKAMQAASEDTVLGNFDGARFTFQGVTSTFFRQDGRFVVRTDGPDGRPTDFDVKYTFGIDPLQQYLVELAGGRLQALSLSWDTRPRSEGGQRWFRQYPNERIDHRDELHWTRPSQNWNFMCADCHSTQVRKGYDAASDRYATTYAEISVGCESCHGPGSAHVAWADKRHPDVPGKGLTVALEDRRGVTWTPVPGGAARRSAPPSAKREMDVCAQCHARRAQFAEGYRAGQRFMDHYLPARLSPGLYHADGQQQDEVFVWGSFQQSRMHAAGVTCSDCHDPHTQALRAPGNAMCATCHDGARYDGPQHHRHASGTAGAQCVDCHMPAATYMVIDPRRDHSFRVPRPDLSVTLGTPNACTQCHTRQTAAWAAAAVASWNGPERARTPHYGQALELGRRRAAGAAPALVALVDDASQAAIVRASALDLLAAFPGSAAESATRRALGDADPLVRHAAVAALPALAPQTAPTVVVALLHDPVRAVRIEAARILLRYGPPPHPTDAAAFDRALGEYEASLRFTADRPEAWIGLADLALFRRDVEAAEAAYREALRRHPAFVPASVNLADLLRNTQREADAQSVLHEALRAVPGSAGLHEALGLSLVRQGRKAEALAQFAAAHRAAPGQERPAYVYAIALADAGRQRDAMRVLEAQARSGGGRDVWLALAELREQSGDRAGASAALASLAAINPDDPALAALRSPR